MARGRLLLPISLALVTALWSTSCLHAQPQTIEELQQLFETDPATAFEEAWRMFQEPMQNDDLEGMYGIIGVVAPHAGRCCYAAVIDEMIDAALPLAEAGGRWEVVGNLCAARAGISGTVHALYGRSARTAHFARRALEALTKAGAEQSRIEWLRNLSETHDLGEIMSQREELRARMCGPNYGPIAVALDTAVSVGDDARALSLMREILGRASQEPPQAEGTERGGPFWGRGVEAVAEYLWLRETQGLVLQIRSLVEMRPDSQLGTNPARSRLAMGCQMAWGGRHDVFCETFHWCWQGSDFVAEWMLPDFIGKARSFGRREEADWLTLVWARGSHRQRASMKGANLAHAGLPRELRRALIRLALGGAMAYVNRLQSPEHDLPRIYTDYLANAPADEREAWAVEAGLEFVDVGLGALDVPSRSALMEEAVNLFDTGQRPDLAQRTRKLLTDLMAGDPGAMLRPALAIAQTAASEGRWQDMVGTLEPALANVPASQEALDGLVLLAGAYGDLGDGNGTVAVVERAHAVLEALSPSAADRATRLVSLAHLSPQADQRTVLLDQARQAAADAGLEIMQEGIAAEQADLALESGDLQTARQALLALVEQEEAKRERLALDPLLRQQWFADSLGPYRKLLKVAALQRDAALALDCAERMRSRALLDQLAWRKVDMGVKLDKPTQERLGALRETRRLAYGLLQRAMGGGSAVLSEDERGLYMPIRGLYMPIRGPLDETKPITDEETTQLKAFIEKLGAEEAALESAIREAVPAYQRASQTPIPTAEELSRVLARDFGLAALEYTLSDEGVVLVGMRGAKPPKIVVIPEKGDALWERIGHACFGHACL